MYTIDDSSGFNIDCTLPLEPRQETPRNVLAPGPPIPPEYNDFDVGHVVDLRGPIVPYRRQKAIKIRRMKLVPTTQHELILWERRFRFRTEVLDVPWALSDAEVRGHRKAAEGADAKDLRLASARRRRRPHQKDEDGAAERVGDLYKLRKRVARPVDARSDRLAHRPRDPSNDMTVASDEKQPGPVSVPEAVSGGGNGEDPYKLKSARSMRPALSTGPRTSPTRKTSCHDDPFRITKRGSGRPLKPSAQPLVLTDEISSVKGPSSSTSSQPRSSRSFSSKHSSVGEVGSPNVSQTRQPIPAQTLSAKPDLSDDPCAIKARYTRRTSALKPTAPGQDTRVDPVKVTKSRIGPCSEKIYNIDLRGSDKMADPAAVDHLKAGREYGESGRGAGVDDPFKLRKRLLN